MARPIVYDLVRLVLSAMRSTPRGIERIDLGYALHLFETWPEDCIGLLPTPWGVRGFSRETVLKARPYFDTAWRETIADGDDPVLAAAVAGPGRGGPLPDLGTRRKHPGLAGIARLLMTTGIPLGRSFRSFPQGALYLNIGHDGLTYPALVWWLRQRPDLLPVFMIHDVIPLSHAQYVEPASHRRHRTVLDHTARHAHLVIVPSHAAGGDVRVELQRRSARDIPIHAAPLPITDNFIEAGLGQRPAPLLDTPYFVVCGALEPRKNHAVVFAAWRALAAEAGERTPILFVAGSRGSLSGSISVELDALVASGLPVRWLDGLSTPGLIRLIQGARALLMPSLVEGFGLPVAEALALGTPALVSDIPAHREAGSDGACYLPPGDSGAWVDAISSLTFDDAAFAAAQARAQATPVRSWPTYLEGITGVLKGL